MCWSDRVREQPRLRDHLPLIADGRVDLACPPRPVLLETRRSVPPARVDVDDREPAILFRGYHDPAHHPHVAHERVRIEQCLPGGTPPTPVIAPEHELPLHRVVRLSGWRPRPDHVMVENGQEQLDVLCIPGPRLALDDFLDCGVRVGHMHPRCVKMPDPVESDAKRPTQLVRRQTGPLPAVIRRPSLGQPDQVRQVQYPFGRVRS